MGQLQQLAISLANRMSGVEERLARFSPPGLPAPFPTVPAFPIPDGGKIVAEDAASGALQPGCVKDAVRRHEARTQTRAAGPARCVTAQANEARVMEPPNTDAWKLEFREQLQTRLLEQSESAREQLEIRLLEQSETAREQQETVARQLEARLLERLSPPASRWRPPPESWRPAFWSVWS